MFRNKKCSKCFRPAAGLCPYSPREALCTRTPLFAVVPDWGFCARKPFLVCPCSLLGIPCPDTISRLFAPVPHWGSCHSLFPPCVAYHVSPPWRHLNAVESGELWPSRIETHEPIAKNCPKWLGLYDREPITLNRIWRKPAQGRLQCC